MAVAGGRAGGREDMEEIEEREEREGSLESHSPP